ncbi:hypothetical protein FRC12_015362 [Ceratobasidium sp. 428]|nr:hypothetical protein FRC12_015362 [Ceratobasidium sp. 428]
MASTSTGNSSSFVEIGTTIKSALNEWENARSVLVTTINLYVSACAVLQTACARPAYYSNGIEEALATVDFFLETLKLEEEKLRSARTSLTVLRNKSTTLSRVNKLPPEILSYVFVLAKSHCVHDEDFGPHGPAAVCTYWRQTATNTPNLWSHIDIGPGTRERLAKLLLDRTKDYPIHIHAHELDTDSTDGEPTLEGEAEEVVKLLEPHIGRVRSLDIQSRSKSSAFIPAMLKMWLFYGSPLFSKSLLVSRPTSGVLLRVQAGQTPSVKRTRKTKNADDILLSLDTLHLQGVTISYNSNAYRDLTDLRLDLTKEPDSIPISQLANILSASPAISILKLGGIDIIGEGEWVSSDPVILGSLKVLKLFGIENNSLRLVLSLIGLPDTPVELSLSFTGYLNIHDELVAFFRGARISVLHLCSYRADTNLSPTWLPLSELRTLILENHQWNFLSMRGLGATSSQSTPFPRLTVILLRCQIGYGYLQTFINNFYVRELYLEQCVPVYRGGMSPQVMGDLLFKKYPRLRCCVSDTVDSTSRLPCRTVLNDYTK